LNSIYFFGGGGEIIVMVDQGLECMPTHYFEKMCVSGVVGFDP
jgi:hypothetical protein